MKKTIKVDDINSSGIRAQAIKDGLADIEMLATSGNGSARITVYRFGEVRVAVTNGDPVWEESDPEAFDELLAEYGITL
jgi:hypothetical protein